MGIFYSLFFYIFNEQPFLKMSSRFPFRWNLLLDDLCLFAAFSWCTVIIIKCFDPCRRMKKMQNNCSLHKETKAFRETLEITLTSIGSRGPLVVSRYFFKSHVKNSKTRYNLDSSWRTFSRFTTLGWCLSSLRSEISLTAVEGTPSSSTSRRIFFKAANFPVLVFLAL